MTTPALAHVYPWLKALHVISLIAWMAGLLYLPRLFVYHCDAASGLRESGAVQGDGASSARQITTPAMIATLDVGISPGS